MPLFRDEDLTFETNAIGVSEFLKTLGPEERIRFETLFDYEFRGTAQQYEEEEDFIGSGDKAYNRITDNHHWRIQEGLFNVRHFDDGSVEIVQIEPPHAYKGKGK